MNSRVEKRYFLKGKLKGIFILKESILQAFLLANQGFGWCLSIALGNLHQIGGDGGSW